MSDKQKYKPMSGAEVLDQILFREGMTHASLAKLLGYSSPQLLYNISKGITKNISVALSERLLKAFPYYNRGWLLSGEGSMLVGSERISPLREAYEFLRSMGIVRTQTDVAVKTGYHKSAVSQAFHGVDGYVTSRFIETFNQAFGGLFNEAYLLRGEGTLLNDPESSVSG